MKFIDNKFLFIVLLGLVLGGCSAATDGEESSESTTEESVVEAEEKIIVADEITTTFYPEVTRLRDLTEEDLEWYDIIMTRLNAIDDFSGDRETVYEIAEEYGEDPEELWFNWSEIIDAKWHSDKGDFAILTDAYHKLTTDIMEKNIVGENIEYLGGGSTFGEGGLTTYSHEEVLVDGEPYRVSYVIEHRDDFKIAEITEFRVNGEKIEF